MRVYYSDNNLRSFFKEFGHTLFQVIEGSINLSKSNLLLDEYLELSVEEINKAIKELNV